MKPRIFIGSSTAAKDYAGAIHDSLVYVAECTVWTEGAFGLSQSTVDSLMKHLRTSDFGIFVFAPDDTATIKGDFLKVTRDNVVYEAGLFGGYLSPERCFIVIPLSTTIRMPTDLLGMTVGHYEDARTDKNYISAVSGFCRQVEVEIERQGLFGGHLDVRLRELAVQFECCDFVPDGNDPKDPSRERVAKKRLVSRDIAAYCRAQPVNKHRLLCEQRHGYCYVLLTAIEQRPEEGDVDLLLQIEQKALPPVFILHKLVEAVEAIKMAHQLDKTKAMVLQQWAVALPGITPELKDRILRATA